MLTDNQYRAIVLFRQGGAPSLKDQGGGGSRRCPTKIRVPVGCGFGAPKTLNGPCGAVAGTGWLHSSAVIFFISDAITARFNAFPTLISPAPFSQTITPSNREPARSIKRTANGGFNFFKAAPRLVAYFPATGSPILMRVTLRKSLFSPLVARRRSPSSISCGRSLAAVCWTAVCKLPMLVSTFGTRTPNWISRSIIRLAWSAVILFNRATSRLAVPKASYALPACSCASVDWTIAAVAWIPASLIELSRNSSSRPENPKIRPSKTTSPTTPAITSNSNTSDKPFHRSSLSFWYSPINPIAMMVANASNAASDQWRPRSAPIFSNNPNNA